MSRSLRSIFLIGSILWTLGFLAIAHTVSIGVIHRYPVLRIHTGPHAVGLVVAGAVMMVIGLARVRRGLNRFDTLRAGLTAVRDGAATRVEGAYPPEVQPLVHDLNQLLEHRERAIARAVAKAGDLAHGLKTPLAVIAREAERADPEARQAIEQQIERMRRQIDYHLAHARSAASGASPGARASVHDSAESLGRVLRRLYADRAMTLQIDTPAEHMIRGQREDLDEMLGNLLDNAFKWASSAVYVTCTRQGANVIIDVDDDGSGIAESERALVLERGIRADETEPGSGLGLAIVRDLAQLYGGSIEIGTSPLGGVRARLTLPAA